MRPYRMVAELVSTGQPEKFAILSIDPSKRHPDGGCVGIVLSLHMTREEAEQARSEQES